ncbi:hypothetical protein ACQ3I4_11585 [Zafaria sp. Z1313]|uniref:hypothetical protein n=1 Tax=Zafaria sp. Z1313 TaxID=3423202 RepID=UPI003D301E61
MNRPMSEGRFWNSREFLATIHNVALARLVSPYAVLAHVLARVAASTPPHVVLPAFVGSKGSLNVIIALVGPSGSGKGAASGASHDAVVTPEVFTAPLGSGEGMVKAFAHRERNKDNEWNTVMDRTRVLFHADEADTLAALGSRTGSTTSSLMRSAWSGERLGATYADETKRVVLEPHSYRAVVTLGVQPKRSATLLGEAAGGTPQRVLWMPSTYAELVEDPPEPFDAYELPVLNWDGASGAGNDFLIEFPAHVAACVRKERLKNARGESEVSELDSHSTQSRLKVAALLAILNGKKKASRVDWHLAGHIMAVSDRTRSECTAAIEELEADASRERGRQRAVEKSAREDHEADQKNKRWASMHRQLTTSNSMLYSALYKSITRSQRRGPDHFKLEVESYVRDQWLLHDEQTNRYRLGPKAEAPAT